LTTVTHVVEKLANEVRALPAEQLEEFLAWLADFEAGRMDAWDSKLARDSRPDGRLREVISRAEADIATGRTRPLDEIIDDH
jgi:hypothetical protein